MDRVREQVDEHLRNLHSVRLDGPQIAVWPQNDRDAMLPPLQARELQRIGHDRVEVDQLALRLAPTNKFANSAKHFGHRSEEHTSELQSRGHLVCRLLLEKKKSIRRTDTRNTRSAHAEHNS